MKDQLSELAVTAVKVLSPVIIALLALLSKKLVELIDARVKNETVKGILERLDQLSFAVVTEIQQTVVDNLDPNAPKESLLKARDAAVANLKTLLGQKGIDDVKRVLGLGDGSIDKILITFIESKVHEVKVQSGSTTSIPAPTSQQVLPKVVSAV